MDIGNNANVNSKEDINKNSGVSNNFRNKIYKLIFKGIKLQN